MLVSNVKKIMEDKGVSIHELARITGVSVETIQRARRGAGKNQLGSCSLLTLKIIADGLGVKIKDLFSEE